MAKLEMKDIPECQEYISVAQAAKVFGIKKASMFYKIYDQQLFRNVCRVGGGPDGLSTEGDRPILLLDKAEVLAVKAAEDQAREAAAAPTPERLLNEWNHRVKEWGSTQSEFPVIWALGRPTNALCRAYVQAHPDDPRPA